MKNLFERTAAIMAIAIVSSVVGAGIFSVMHPSQPTSIAGSFNPTGGTSYNLLSSIGANDTSITLASFTEPVSNIKYTMSYLNSTIEFGTIAPNTPYQEFISFTGITQNANHTATLTGVTRGLSPSYPYTASSTFAISHNAPATFVLSNSPQFYQQFSITSNSELITGVWKFGSTSPPAYDFNPNFTNLSSTTLASVSYVQQLQLNGCSNANTTTDGCVQIATQTQAASSTITGSTGANVVIPASMSTSSPGSAGIWNVITTNAGKISQTFLDIFSTANTWSVLQTFAAGFIDNASSTIASPLTVTGILSNTATTSLLAFSSSSISTSTIAGNLTIAKNASTTNLVISGNCSGCSGAVSTSSPMGNFNGGTPSISSGSVSCTAPKVVSGCSLSPVQTGSAGGNTASAYPSSAGTCSGTQYGTNGGSGSPGNNIYAICINP